MVKRSVKISSALLSVVAVVIAVYFNSKNVDATTNEVCKTVEECDALINMVNDELEALEELSDKTEYVKKEIEARRQSLTKEVEAIRLRITTTEQKIRLVEEEIEAKEAEIEVLNRKIEEQKDFIFAQTRLEKRNQKTNSFLVMISQSESLVDLIKNFRAYVHVSNYTKAKMDEIKEMVSTQQELKYQLIQNKALVVEERKNLQADKERLEIAINEAIAEEQRLIKELQALQEQMIDAEEVRRVIEAQRTEIIRETNEVFGIPLATGYVSCEFACYIDKNGIPHNGIDLGNYGNTSTPVVASASGKVIRSGWHNAYGNYVIISHNINGKVYTTLYAHMHTRPMVSVGDYVSKGQQLGTMGTTGNSSGPHLHFELYEGYYNWPHSVNPRKYINFPSRW